MSEVLDNYKKQKIDWKLKLSTEAPLSYVRRQVDVLNDILFCVEIPWPLLHLWYKFLEGVPAENVNYVDLINSTVTDHWFSLKRDNIRIETTLRKKCSYVKAVCSKTKGRKRTDLDDKVYKLSVRRGEIESIEMCKSEARICSEELEQYKEKYTDLEKETKKLYQDMIQEVKKLEQQVCELQDINKHLMDYIETIEKRDSLQCQGKKFQDVGKKQQSRKLRLLKNKAQCALWFCRSFGLELSHVKLQDDKGSSYSLDYEVCTGDADISTDDKSNLEKVLFLLDKFCVGDEVYHELSVLSDDLPRSYLIKQLRSDLNKTCHIERTVQYPGAKVDFTSTLADHVKALLAKKPELQEVKVKLSGDGAQMSRTTNFMMFSFALLQEENVMSSKSNRTVAIINGKEDYITVKTALPSFFQEVNSLIQRGAIIIDGKEVKLEFFLGGDYKFLLMIMGLNSATANHACLWCNVHKQNRWDTSKAFNFYNEEPQMRTLEAINKMRQLTINFGCINAPLIHLELDLVVPDELHLLLRITDRLLQNVIDEILERDAIEDFNKSTQPKGVLLKQFVKGVNELGITFSVWYKKNADGSSSNVLDYTSLVGGQKKLMLNKVPSILHEYLYPGTSAIVCKIWENFKDYYDFIASTSLTSDSSTIIFEKAKKWLELFCSLRSLRPGYTRARVTPYMHIMYYHVPYFIQQHGCFKIFTGQGVEKNNDDAKRVLFQKSNKWDAAKDILLMESRQWELKEHERKKAPYTKRNHEYWDVEISRARKERRMLSEPSTPQVLVEDNDTPNSVPIGYNKFTVVQLREMVKGKGLKQRGLAKLKKNELIALLEAS